MPGAGKSTVGKLLANRLSMKFCDTDQLIESTQQDSLQNILDAQGCWAPLFELKTPGSRYDEGSEAPFRGRKVHYQNRRR